MKNISETIAIIPQICPICGKIYDKRPAVSRRNGRKICPECGQREAIEDFLNYLEDNGD